MKIIGLLIILFIIISVIRSNGNSSKAGATRSMNTFDKIFGFFLVIKSKIKKFLER